MSERRVKPLQRKVIEDAKLRASIDEFLREQLKEAGYGGMRMASTPVGTQISVLAHRPGLVIGTGGRSIRDLTKALEERFRLPNPQLGVVEVESPELEAYIMATRIGEALEKGVRYRRAANWAIGRIMRAGALGAQIVIRGKLTSDRSRFEKFTEGYIPSSGDPAVKSVRTGVRNVLLKQGLIGVKVKILPPGVSFPDDVKIKDVKIEPVQREEAEQVEEGEKPGAEQPQQAQEVVEQPAVQEAKGEEASAQTEGEAAPGAE